MSRDKTLLEEFKADLGANPPAQLAYAKTDGHTVTVPQSTVGRDGVDLDEITASNQEVADSRALQRAVQPLLDAGRWGIAGFVSGAENAVVFSKVPRMVPYTSIPLGARLLADSRDTSRTLRVEIDRWRYEVNEKTDEITIYPNGDDDKSLDKQINALLPRGYKLISMWRNVATGAVKDPVVLKAPSAKIVGKDRYGAYVTETEVAEGSFDEYIRLDEQIQARNEEESK